MKLPSSGQRMLCIATSLVSAQPSRNYSCISDFTQGNIRVCLNKLVNSKHLASTKCIYFIEIMWLRSHGRPLHPGALELKEVKLTGLHSTFSIYRNIREPGSCYHTLFFIWSVISREVINFGFTGPSDWSWLGAKSSCNAEVGVYSMLGVSSASSFILSMVACHPRG